MKDRAIDTFRAFCEGASRKHGIPVAQARERGFKWLTTGLGSNYTEANFRTLPDFRYRQVLAYFAFAKKRRMIPFIHPNAPKAKPLQVLDEDAIWSNFDHPAWDFITAATPLRGKKSRFTTNIGEFVP